MFRTLVLFALGLATIQAAAQPSYPIKPIQVVVPYGPGGAVDVIGRIVTEHMVRTLGQPIVVLNRPGADASIGPGIVAQSPPDGYTLLASSSATIVNPLLDKSLRWNAESFVPVARFVQSPSLIVVPSSSRLSTLAEFVAHAKANPGLTTSMAGLGSTQAMAREYFAKAAGISLLDVSYKGGVSYIPDLISGTLAMSVAPLNVVLPLVKDRKLNALANTSDRRSALLPDVPTVAEAGYPEATSISWYGFHAPAGTPRAIIQKIADAVRAATTDPQVMARIALIGGEIAYLDTPGFESFLAADQARAERFVQAIKSR